MKHGRRLETAPDLADSAQSATAAYGALWAWLRSCLAEIGWEHLVSPRRGCIVRHAHPG